MNVAKSYRNAVNVLRPNRAEMERRHAPYKALVAEAETLVAAMLESMNKSPRELYDIQCELRHANESELSKTCRVVLLGMVRRAK